MFVHILISILTAKFIQNENSYPDRNRRTRNYIDSEFTVRFSNNLPTKNLFNR